MGSPPPSPLPPDPGFWSDLLAFARHSKKWWLIPLILVLLAVGVFMLFMASAPAQAFIYTLF